MLFGPVYTSLPLDYEFLEGRYGFLFSAEFSMSKIVWDIMSI